ncbi:PLP-dependent aminotransferase family protein [Paraburkholderia sp. A3BS-1L]|uniref:MocR-like pyridoxine biosynthesis transcription factor PdxR n=1 Tax=Paraburkholderia sp. A3BS-1L TaxID=3028375 RepID=UPI003DA8C526
MKVSGGVLLADIALDRTSDVPLHRQLYLQIRRQVLSGRLTGGTRLPSTRTLIRELGVSRITIVNAFEQLGAEGFLTSRIGAGTYVADEWCAQHRPPLSPERPHLSARGAATISARGDLFSRAPRSWSTDESESFISSQGAFEEFPVRVWKPLLSRHGSRRDIDLLGYGDPLGYRPLREAIADYLNDVRGLDCEVDQIAISSGAQQAFNVLAMLLLDPDDAVWVEDPGHIAARLAFQAQGCRLCGVALDDQGADVSFGIARHSRARLAFVTPSRQHPVGMTMSLGRRMEWIDWARDSQSWIIEDDCDSELRYRGPLLPTLFGLDRNEHVIYVGTLSKVMFPSLRLGYVVLPKDLVAPFAAVCTVIGRSPSTLMQAVAADFIREGHLQTHIRHTRGLYQRRQHALLTELGSQLGHCLSAAPVDAGMHVLGWLNADVDDQHVARALAQRGVYTYALGEYCLQQTQRPALLIGFAGTAEANMRRAVAHMAEALKQLGLA